MPAQTRYEQRWWQVVPYLRELPKLTRLSVAAALYTEVAHSPTFANVPWPDDVTPAKRGEQIVEALRRAVEQTDVRSTLGGSGDGDRADVDTAIAWCEYVLDGKSPEKISEEVCVGTYDHPLSPKTVRERMWLEPNSYTKKSWPAIVGLIKAIHAQLGAVIALTTTNNDFDSEAGVVELGGNRVPAMGEVLQEHNSGTPEKIITEQEALRALKIMADLLLDPELREQYDVFALLTAEQRAEVVDDALQKYMPKLAAKRAADQANSG